MQSQKTYKCQQCGVACGTDRSSPRSLRRSWELFGFWIVETHFCMITNQTVSRRAEICETAGWLVVVVVVVKWSRETFCWIQSVLLSSRSSACHLLCGSDWWRYQVLLIWCFETTTRCFNPLFFIFNFLLNNLRKLFPGLTPEMFPFTSSLLLLLLAAPALLTPSTYNQLKVRGQRTPRDGKQDSIKVVKWWIWMKHVLLNFIQFIFVSLFLL